MLQPNDLLCRVCELHYFPLNHRIRHPETRRQYLIAIANFGEPLQRDPVIDDLTDDNVSRMVGHLLELGLAETTINERRHRIHALWGWLAKRGVLNRWPTTPSLPEPHRVPLAWTEAEIRSLFSAAATLRGNMAGIPRWLWWTCLLGVAWDTGERIGALLLIDWSCVDLDTRWLVVPAEARKGKRKDMVYRLAPETIASLRLLKKYTQPFGAVLHWPRNRCYLWEAFGKLIADAGLPVQKRQKFHRLRRSVASHYEAAGYDAMKLLGHSSRSITEGYLDPRIVRPPQASEVLFRPAG